MERQRKIAVIATVSSLLQAVVFIATWRLMGRTPRRQLRAYVSGGSGRYEEMPVGHLFTPSSTRANPMKALRRARGYVTVRRAAPRSTSASSAAHARSTGRGEEGLARRLHLRREDPGTCCSWSAPSAHNLLFFFGGRHRPLAAAHTSRSAVNFRQRGTCVRILIADRRLFPWHRHGRREARRREDDAGGATTSSAGAVCWSL